MFEQSGNFHFINLTSRHERGAAVNTALSFYIAIPANTPLWFVVLFHHHYMYGTFGNVEHAGRIPYGRVVFDDIFREHNRSFLGQSFQDENPPCNVV